MIEQLPKQGRWGKGPLLGAFPPARHECAFPAAAGSHESGSKTAVSRGTSTKLTTLTRTDGSQGLSGGMSPREIRLRKEKYRDESHARARALGPGLPTVERLHPLEAPNQTFHFPKRQIVQ